MRRILVLFLFSTSLAIAQTCTQTMPATVLDEQNRVFDPTITRGKLQAKSGGTELPIASVERIASFRLLILIDASGSMDAADAPHNHQQKALALINNTLDKLLDALPPGVQVEYGLFNTHAVFGPGFSADAEAVRQSLPDLAKRLKHPGIKETALYDAIAESVARFDSTQPGDSILVLTDGDDNASHVKNNKVQSEAARRGVRVFTILFKSDNPFIKGFRVEIFDYADRTGGTVYVADVERNLWLAADQQERIKQDLVRFLMNEILSGYWISFNLPEGVRSRKWTLSIDQQPHQKDKLLVTYPSRLNTCSATTAALP
jgi:hypothetical protein